MNEKKIIRTIKKFAKRGASLVEWKMILRQAWQFLDLCKGRIFYCEFASSKRRWQRRGENVMVAVDFARQAMVRQGLPIV